MTLMQLHEGLQQRFPTILWQGNPLRREIALTFDNGPDPQSTPVLLRLLDQYGITATFFQVGEQAERAPHLTLEVTAAGHQVGLHGYTHQSFLLKDPVTLREELAEMQRVLAAASGGDPSAFDAVHPPFGHFTPAILKMLSEAGYLPTMWSVVVFDRMRSAEVTVEQVLVRVGNGSILVLDEGLAGTTMFDLTEEILSRLVAQDYRFVTIHEMWMHRNQSVS